jgi:hypothetical protein
MSLNAACSEVLPDGDKVEYSFDLGEKLNKEWIVFP